MEYTVVARLSTTLLIEVVNDLLKENWMLYGDFIAIRDTTGNVEYLQPMVKYEAIKVEKGVSATYKGKLTKENIFTVTDVPITP